MSPKVRKVVRIGEIEMSARCDLPKDFNQYPTVIVKLQNLLRLLVREYSRRLSLEIDQTRYIFKTTVSKEYIVRVLIRASSTTLCITRHCRFNFYYKLFANRRIPIVKFSTVIATKIILVSSNALV